MPEETIISPLPPEEETVVAEEAVVEAAPEEVPVEEPAGEPKDEVKEALQGIREDMKKLHDRYGYLQRQLEKAPQAPPEIEVPAKAKPRVDDFEDYDAYVEAVTDWKIEQREGVQRAERAKIEQQNKGVQFQARLNEGFKAHDDFQEVVFNPNLTISPPMVEALHDCDHAAEIAYHLGQNIDLARNIASLNPIAAAREIGKLDAVFSKGPPPPQKSTTKAPVATKPVGGKEGAPKNLEDMSVSEYIAYKNRQEAGAL